MAVVSAAAGACTVAGESARSPAPEGAVRAQALIDAGNRAYEVGDYALAARRFGAAAVVDENDPAAYFGLGMALSKLGRDEDARIAYARARRLAQERQEQERDAVGEPFGVTPDG